MLFVVTLWCRFFFARSAVDVVVFVVQHSSPFYIFFFLEKIHHSDQQLKHFRGNISPFFIPDDLFFCIQNQHGIFFYGMLIIVFLCSTFHSISHFAWIHLHTDNKHTTHKILTHIIHRTISINFKNDIRQVHVQNKMCKKNELKIYASNAWQKKHTLSTVCIYCTVHSTCGFFCLSDS